jgi:hypothetical protein
LAMKRSPSKPRTRRSARNRKTSGLLVANGGSEVRVARAISVRAHIRWHSPMGVQGAHHVARVRSKRLDPGILSDGKDLR